MDKHTVQVDPGSHCPPSRPSLNFSKRDTIHVYLPSPRVQGREYVTTDDISLQCHSKRKPVLGHTAIVLVVPQAEEVYTHNRCHYILMIQIEYILPKRNEARKTIFLFSTSSHGNCCHYYRHWQWWLAITTHPAPPPPSPQAISSLGISRLLSSRKELHSILLSRFYRFIITIKRGGRHTERDNELEIYDWLRGNPHPSHTTTTTTPGTKSLSPNGKSSIPICFNHLLCTPTSCFVPATFIITFRSSRCCFCSWSIYLQRLWW